MSKLPYINQVPKDEHDSASPETKRVSLYGWDVANAQKVRIAANPGGSLVGNSQSDEYNTNNIDTTTTTNTVYIGMTNASGAWYVKRINTSTKAFTHATITNNALVTTYTDAWSAITTLTYGRYEEAF